MICLAAEAGGAATEAQCCAHGQFCIQLQREEHGGSEKQLCGGQKLEPVPFMFHKTSHGTRE